ncbi:hypothetical protein HN51_036848 [Arachis hypogaea]
MVKILNFNKLNFVQKLYQQNLKNLRNLDSENPLLHESKKSKSIFLSPLSNASVLDSRKKKRATGL